MGVRIHRSLRTLSSPPSSIDISTRYYDLFVRQCECGDPRKQVNASVCDADPNTQAEAAVDLDAGLRYTSGGGNTPMPFSRVISRSDPQ